MHQLFGRNSLRPRVESESDQNPLGLASFQYFVAYLNISFRICIQCQVIYANYHIEMGLHRYYYNKETKQSKWTIPDELKVCLEKKFFDIAFACVGLTLTLVLPVGPRTG